MLNPIITEYIVADRTAEARLQDEHARLALTTTRAARQAGRGARIRRPEPVAGLGLEPSRPTRLRISQTGFRR